MKKLLIITGVVLVVLAALHWPVATWLQVRGSWLGVDERVDAVYLMGGQWDHERVDGLVEWLKGGGQTGLILVPDDPSKGRWSRRAQRNLSAVEWTLESLHQALQDGGLKVPVEVVTTSMNGTDAEVASLARLLLVRQDIQTVALTTSRFHVRRTLSGAARHFDVVPGVVPAITIWQDRWPWVVSVELTKMLRDALGLTHVPLLNRWWWSARFARRSMPTFP